MIKNVKEMMIVRYKTCDAFDPITCYETNPHYVYYVIIDIKGDKVKWMNLKNQKISKQHVKFVQLFCEEVKE